MSIEGAVYSRLNSASIASLVGQCEPGVVTSCGFSAGFSSGFSVCTDDASCGFSSGFSAGFQICAVHLQCIGRIYPTFPEAQITYEPFITYDLRFFGDNLLSGKDDYQQAQVRIDVYGPVYAENMTIVAAIIERFEGWFTSQIGFSKLVQVFDDEEVRHHTILYFKLLIF